MLGEGRSKKEETTVLKKTFSTLSPLDTQGFICERHRLEVEKEQTLVS